MSVKTRLKTLIARLAEVLTAKGVEASAEETLTALVDKVSGIEQGGENKLTAAYWSGQEGLTLTAADFDGVTTLMTNALSYLKLAALELPDTLVKMNEYACAYMRSSVSGGLDVILPAGVSTVGDYMFRGAAVRSVDASHLTKIPTGFCYENSYLVQANMSDDVTAIKNNAFMSCINLLLDRLPTGLTEIGQQAFSSCRKITVQSIPIGVTTLPIGVFYNCWEIPSIVAPGVTSIPATGTSAGQFGQCVEMTSAAIGSEGHAVTNIGGYAFRGCNALTSLTVYTADGQPLENSPFGAANATVEYIQA